ncbi:response regulator [Desulfuromonas sp. TF]|uniref:response regulator n=1 Tax=Desulfuromonas sp. TF TaxID=1232410 RepID=UPI0004068B2F|nr:response regulator [Desulfuromonas sp. TF]
MRILIAEDDPTVRQMMSTLLSRKRIDCTVVGDGLSAVEAWEESDYDFILMDVQMPVMDGLSATRKIREKESERGGHTIIIALTAYAMAGDRKRCLDAGMDEYMSKPIDFEQLFSLVDDYLQQGR